MLCDSGDCHCFSSWGNIGVVSRTQEQLEQTHTFTIGSHKCNICLQRDNRFYWTEKVFSHELLFCKPVVLQTVNLSVECCKMYDVPKGEFLTLIIIKMKHSTCKKKKKKQLQDVINSVVFSLFCCLQCSFSQKPACFIYSSNWNIGSTFSYSAK